jgi:hypothetical protein
MDGLVARMKQRRNVILDVNPKQNRPLENHRRRLKKTDGNSVR